METYDGVSIRQLFNYSNRVFALPGHLQGFTDRRRKPWIPLSGILWAWVLGFWRELPSTEALGRRIREAAMRRYAGLRVDQVPSPDRLGEVLEVVVASESEALMHELFWQARRSKLLETSTVVGLRLAGIDLNELFCSQAIHCDQCQQRTKHLKRDDRTEDVTEYYHQVVCLQWLGGTIPWPLGWELLRPGEGELTAALRLLDRVLPILRPSLDAIVGDGLYDCRPYWQCLARHHLDGLALMTREESLLWNDIELYARMEKPTPTPALQAQGWRAWEMTSDGWEKELQTKLRLIRFVREREKPAYKNERKQLTLATTFSDEQAGLYRLWKAGLSRWSEENRGFNEYTQFYHLTHNYHHQPAALLALVVLMSISHCVKLAYFRFAQSYRKVPRPRVQLREQLIDSFVAERRPSPATVHTASQPPP